MFVCSHSNQFGLFNFHIETERVNQNAKKSAKYKKMQCTLLLVHVGLQIILQLAASNC